MFKVTITIELEIEEERAIPISEVADELREAELTNWSSHPYDEAGFRTINVVSLTAEARQNA